MKIFIHGVPDTPAMWDPLLSALSLPPDTFLTPALPGFSTPLPPKFSATKEAYVDWLIDYIEQHRNGAQVDLVGHDWGAILVTRIAMLRPDLVRSWAVANALPEPSYNWHRTARLWQTPVVGELVMALTPRKRLAAALTAAGMPAAMAKHETAHWSPDMRKAILRLYRSARNVSSEWTDELDRLPSRALVFWGDDDPFVPTETAERFCSRLRIPLHRNSKTGHWSIVERADHLSNLLKALWAD
ncbi:alpha/beta fold hydrolase [Henriciella litoralis]|uniref:alpha/beta fold hydrolase n=1 Tax=Henriciella litoralis TaxID=568102 RepID=UPI000A046690|nr:alpha/beta hydrolase [Henriciella litoralis]